jgi:hypothetical protein
MPSQPLMRSAKCGWRTDNRQQKKMIDQELDLICQFYRVLAVLCEFPSNDIIVVIKVDVLKESPKLHKLCEMVYGKI